MTSLPQYIVYRYLQRAAPRTVNDATGDLVGAGIKTTPRVRMHALTPISGRELTALAVGTPLISYGRPLPNTTTVIGGNMDVDKDGKPSNLGPGRECSVQATLGAGNGRAGWPMGVVRVRQTRDRMGAWVVQKLLS